MQEEGTTVAIPAGVPEEPTSLQREVYMARYWIENKGLERAFKTQLTELAADPAIAAALVQMQNAERAIKARIAELVEQLPEEMERYA